MKHFKNWLIMGTKYERYHISFKAFKQLFDSKTNKKILKNYVLTV